ncbi:MAG: elongation factor P maturation arginine rhamnosyltransferase EarP [Betaproteobacteria bacterium]|nr:elongation factor P maturation arginine rhamnosyltransferase EarP [Betaproteobacteria bacterium]
MRGRNWDIFCRVIDNFGDIGFCWRLARQLVAEHDLRVRLWVDDRASLNRLCPEVNMADVEQVLQGVAIRHWTSPFPPVEIADVVIEAFACELPESYLAAMAARPKKPAWINLEYLSAENWVSENHGLASPQPRMPLTKYFFFPGFTPYTGGLLREKNLVRQRTAWQADPGNAWQHLKLPPAEAGEISISLFCYENSALPDLLRCWAAGKTRIRCLIPAGQALTQAASSFPQQDLAIGAAFRQGNLSVHALPFLSQELYDRLLWSCDLNFVRGEDSFVRAQWAARPFVWQIYPQGHAAHHAKLEAFLALYCTRLEEPAKTACRQFWLAWNGFGQTGADQSWTAYWQQRGTLATHASQWAAHLSEAEDMASQLVRFCENLL